MAIEKPKYRVIEKAGPFEIREYEPYIIAEVTVGGSFIDAGNDAFDKLGGYIFGANTARAGISMTSPVAQQKVKRSESISMTSPVAQQKQGDRWRVSFMMPSAYDLNSLPDPDDRTIRFTRVPAKTMAVIVFSGNWSDKNIHRHTEKLKSFISGKIMSSVGEPVVARYNPPFVPPIFRKNEILWEIKV